MSLGRNEINPPDAGTTITLDWFLELYGEFNRRDVAAVLEKLAPDVRWANGWEGGFVGGRRAVEEYWRRQWAELDPSVTPTSVTTRADGSIAVDVHQTIRDMKGGLIAEGMVVHRYVIADGYIAEMSIEA